MVVLLIASGYLNYVLTQKSPADTGGAETAVSSYFAAAKAERQTTRNQEIVYYDAIIASSSSSATEKEAATTAKMKILAFMENENGIETFLFGKGYAASIASCSDGGIYVTVADNDLSAVKVAEIKNFIIEHTDYVLGQINIRSYPV
jgi:stage III sporulation protein AH